MVGSQLRGEGIALRVEDANRTCALADGGVLPQRAPSAKEDSSKGSLKWGIPFTSLLLQSIAITVLVIISYCQSLPVPNLYIKVPYRYVL